MEEKLVLAPDGGSLTQITHPKEGEKKRKARRGYWPVLLCAPAWFGETNPRLSGRFLIALICSVRGSRSTPYREWISPLCSRGGWRRMLLEIARDRLPQRAGALLFSGLWWLAATGLGVLHAGVVLWETASGYSLIGSSTYLRSALDGTSLGFCPLEGGNFESKLSGFSL